MTTQVRIVRVYLTEGDKLLKAIMAYLHDEVKVMGVTVFRAIEGFGTSGIMHSSHILATALDLPLTVEFFDHIDKVQPIIDRLKTMLGETHIVSWQATMG